MAARKKISGLLTREGILECSDMKLEKVQTPEWGGHIFVKTFTAAERDLWEQRQYDFSTEASRTNARRRVRANLAAATVCDEKGKLLFTADDIDRLSEKSAAPLSRIYNVSARLNHLLAQDVKDLEKN